MIDAIDMTAATALIHISDAASPQTGETSISSVWATILCSHDSQA
jgi:hypothetical protein